MDGIDTELVFAGFAPQPSGIAYEVNRPSLDSTNTFEHPNERRT
jgi:hypothetical protein